MYCQTKFYTFQLLKNGKSEIKSATCIPVTINFLSGPKLNPVFHFVTDPISINPSKCLEKMNYVVAGVTISKHMVIPAIVTTVVIDTLVETLD